MNTEDGTSSWSTLLTMQLPLDLWQEPKVHHLEQSISVASGGKWVITFYAREGVTSADDAYHLETNPVI